MNSEGVPRPASMLLGRVVQAEYRDPGVSLYRGNPFLEALPPILTQGQVISRLSWYPPYSADEDRRLPAEHRLHLLFNLLDFFQPLSAHLDLERRISRALRWGYRPRNPLDPIFWPRTRDNLEAIFVHDPAPSVGKSLGVGFTCIGVSGSGKTRSIEAILRLYPQVIIHSEYEGRPFTWTQLVWLKLDCPKDGSIKGLCFSFFQALDQILATSYYTAYTGPRRTVDEMLVHMARLAALHGLGILVIDEIQNLSEAKSGGYRTMLNFFLELNNTIGVPVVLVGTPHALSFLGHALRQVRRDSGQGELLWHPIAFDEEWDLFLESLWAYQYTARINSLTPELSKCLYELSQGIPDFAIKLYMLAQVRAISRADDVINVAVIESVARDSLPRAMQMLKYWRSKDIAKLREIEDLPLIDMDRALTKVLARDVVEVPVSPQPESPKSRARPRGRKSRKQPPKGSLLQIVASGRDRGLSPYQALKDAGLVQSSMEFFDARTRGAIIG